LKIGLTQPDPPGQIALSEPVSQPDPDSRTGVPVSGRWRMHPIGQEETIDGGRKIVDNLVAAPTTFLLLKSSLIGI